jgi:acyl-CoA dehydrogenase
MTNFHNDLLNLSIQQTPAGKLPCGLLKEIKDAGTLAKDLFENVTVEKILEIDRTDFFNASHPAMDIAKEFSKRKLYSEWLPKFVGGGGGHPLAFYGLNLEMGSRCLGLSNLIGAHYVALGLVSATQSFHVLKKITADIKAAEITGAVCTAALAITEPSAGSDMEDVELIEKATVGTKAQKVEGGYKITGQKIFISNSLFSSWIIGSAFTDLKNPLGSLLIFAVKTKTPGVQLGRVEKKLGQQASPASVLFFDNVFVSDEDICFSREQFETEADYLKNAEVLLNDLLSLSRAGVGCLAAGAQKRILEIVIDKSAASQKYEWCQAGVAKIARNFITSKTISWEGHIECYSRGPYKDLQKKFVYAFFKWTPAFLQKATLGMIMSSAGVQKKLRHVRRHSISMADEKLIFGWGSLVKGFCSDQAMESVQLALDLIGNDGSSESLELEKILRDLKLLQIYEGTNELNLLMCFKNFIGDKNLNVQVFRE